MYLNIRYIILLFGTKLIFLSYPLFAQAEIDSTLRYATQQIFENPDSAINISKEVIAGANTSIDDKVRALIIISTAYSSKRDYDKSMEYAKSATAMLPELKDINLRINLLNRLGGLYQELKIYEKAISSLDEALVHIQQLPKGEARSKYLGVNNLLRGFVYRDQMSCEIALNYFEKGIEDYKKFPDTPGGNANISISYYNRGNCLMELGNIEEAEESYIQSIIYAKKGEAISAEAFAQKGLAQVYTLKEKYTDAIGLLESALRKSENVGDKVLNRTIFESLATNYLAVGNLEQYNFYQNQNLDIGDAILKAERSTIDESLKNLQETSQKKNLQLQQKILIFQIASLFIILIISFLLLRRYLSFRKKIKSLNQELNL